MNPNIAKIVNDCIGEHQRLKVANTEELQLDYAGEAKAPSVPIFYPSSTEEVASILQKCNREKVAVVVVGGATNLNQSTVPSPNSMAISLIRMNEVYEIDAFNRYAVVAAGCNTADFVQQVEQQNLYFPQNIASAAHATIGGNLAISSGSPRSLFYGQTKDYVLNLEVVLPDGTVVQTGKNVSKISSGFNLTQLFIGSEGTLGIITKATIKLRPLPTFRRVVQLSFDSFEALFSVFEAIFRKGYEPTSIEFLDQAGVNLIQDYLKQERSLDESYLLWLEWEGHSETYLQETISRFVSDFDEHCQIQVSKTEAENKELLHFRSKIGYAVKHRSYFKDIDVVVPRSEIGKLYEFITQSCEKEKLVFTAFAHIGDGNFHLNILKDDIPEDTWNAVIHGLTRNIIYKAIALGGAVSGEHGIGKANKAVFGELTPATNMAMMRDIKKILDPHGILNHEILIEQQSTSTEQQESNKVDETIISR